MASQPLYLSSGIDEPVPIDDVVPASTQDEPSAATLAGAQAALEIARCTAWIAWQISAQEVNAREADGQLARLTEELERLAPRLPDGLRADVRSALAQAQAAAAVQDLQGVEQAARQIRQFCERFRNTLLA